MIQQILLIYVMHACAWWCLSALSAVIRGDAGAMRHSSAIAIAVFSTALHLTVKALYF